ncbi:MAG: MBL fold metallo-hydrolase [Clostridia bacterium]|nr:MBL fold metallo-hydrolase [Clostridia bacterium]
MKALKGYVTAYHNEVTGSSFLVVIERPDGITNRVLVDKGYFQEPKYRYLNYVDDLDPENIDAIVVTHNHIDHTGLIPKLVRQGYRNKIYMTEITQELIGDFLYDSAEQQEENAWDMRWRYPNEAHKFNALYYAEDVTKTLKLCEGIAYRKTIEILPGIKLTFWENAHILGASMVLLQCYYANMKPLNFLFTGDFKFANSFTRVPMFPKWFRNMELIMFCESTYGTTKREDIKQCFRANILEGFERRQDILIGAFAQDRMQGILYDFKLMQDEGLIPPEYQICVDGPLGISTCYGYRSILEWYNPTRKDFMPKGVRFMDTKSRDQIFEKGIPKIVITTSGMLNNGPAKVYVPKFLVRENALIHLVGYAAEETMARKLLDAKRDETVKIGGVVFQKKAVIKTTREKTSHATEEELLELIGMFNNIKFLGINHGNTDVKNDFGEDVVMECPNVEQVGIMDREHMYSFYRLGFKGDANTRLTVKARSAGLLNDSRLVFGREATSEELRERIQMEKERKQKRREKDARKGKKNGKRNKQKGAKKKARKNKKRN